jgi:DNA recombination protein RmuC
MRDQVSGRSEDGAPCWLPIDCKFLRTIGAFDAIDRADVGAVDQSRKALEDFFKVEARKIRDKYIAPHTRISRSCSFHREPVYGGCHQADW